VSELLEISLEKIEHKHQHEYAHKLLEKCLCRYGIDYKSEKIEKGEYGKPYFSERNDIHYNISHSNGITACYVGRFEAGIDVKPVKKYRPNVVKRVFSDSEMEMLEKSDDKDLLFFRLWTLKESYVKAIGIGVSYPMKNISFSFENGRIISNVENCVFNQTVIGGKYIVSLCRIING
jgi:4'-phosphopantetheinyl transferase